MERTINRRKTEQMVLYFCKMSRQDNNFGRTKLAKLMFYADFFAFKNLGEPITNLAYRKYPQGPLAPEAFPIIAHLVATDAAVEYDMNSGGRLTRTHLLNLVEPDLGCFTQGEVDQMNAVLKKLSAANAATVSRLSHELIGWQLANEKEVIPYGTILISHPQPPVTDKERAFGLQLIESLGLR